MALALLKNLASRPDAQRALGNYRQLAEGYDATCTHIEALRRRALHELTLQPGETVFDVACGTGPMLPLLARSVGAEGRVIGLELSPEMAQQAQRRVDGVAFANRITLAQGAVERFGSTHKADALLFCYAHDVLQSPAAIDRLICMSKPGARVAMVGMKTLPWWWGWPVNAFNLYRARRYLTTYAGLDRPWRLLEEQGASLRQVHSGLWGSAYITVGRMPPDANPPVTPGTEWHIPPPRKEVRCSQANAR
jgi:ubiquinone/menaquinone biosynthesis C-methylase UbiE